MYGFSMKNTAQIILYNQLRRDYLLSGINTFCYIHHTGRITFQWEDLYLNKKSKIIDYAGGKHMINTLKSEWKTVEFLCEKTFFSWLKKFAKKHNIEKFVLVQPVENYVYENFLKIQKRLDDIWVELEIVPDTQSFFLSHDDFRAQYKKPPIMEYFYRFMRKKEDILMDGKDPEGGQWNYDKENRKFDRKHEKSWSFELNKSEELKEAEEYYSDLTPSPSPARRGEFFQVTNREEALKLLDYFIKNHLDDFGRLEDAMYSDDNYVHHSLLSTAINYGMLSPREVVEAVEKTETAMNNKEWFIRQVLGWREYMYHFFQFYKDDIYKSNFLDHTRELPDYFWSDAEASDMKCLSSTLQQVQAENFSHHIQRLMIIGNFSLLSWLNPHELNKWFFEYYTDAFEWVVTPNVLGMSQFADGGNLATKPYVASANYINKMSDYCKGCKYNHKEKYTEDACPFNYLYWNFVHDNKETFEKWRQQFVVNNLKKIDIDKIQELKEKFIKKHS